MAYLSKSKVNFLRLIHSPFVKYRQIVVTSLDVSEFHKDLQKWVHKEFTSFFFFFDNVVKGSLSPQ